MISELIKLRSKLKAAFSTSVDNAGGIAFAIDLLEDQIWEILERDPDNLVMWIENPEPNDSLH